MSTIEIIKLFRDISEKHYELKGFGFGNIFEIGGSIKPGLTYPLLWVVPLDSVTLEQTKQRRFLLLVVSLVQKDLSNRDNVWSDTEKTLDDIIKILRNESDDYELVGDPILNPVSEQHGDWVTGWQTEIVLQTEFNSNYCDVPADNLSQGTIINYATVLDQDDNIVTKLYPRQTYRVVIASGIDEGGASQTYSIQVVDI